MEMKFEVQNKSCTILSTGIGLYRSAELNTTTKKINQGNYHFSEVSFVIIPPDDDTRKFLLTWMSKGDIYKTAKVTIDFQNDSNLRVIDFENVVLTSYSESLRIENLNKVVEPEITISILFSKIKMDDVAFDSMK